MEAKIGTIEADLVAMKTKMEGIRRLIVVNIVISIIFGAVKLFMASHSSPTSASGNSVQIGATAAPVKELSARDYLRTEEVAEREGISPRTVLSLVENNMITPEPVKHGREWRYAKNYAVQGGMGDE